MIPFEQTQRDVAEVKRDLKDLLILLEKKSENNPQTENPLNINELEKLTGYTKPTLYGYCQKNTMPHHKKSGRLFFFKSEIINWIKQGKQKTIDEIVLDSDIILFNKKKSPK